MVELTIETYEAAVARAKDDPELAALLASLDEKNLALHRADEARKAVAEAYASQEREIAWYMKRSLEHPFQLTAREWIERARDNVKERLDAEEDTLLLDVYDDLCNALTVMDGQSTSVTH